MQASQQASPNFNTRPSNNISLLVVHNISLPAGCFNTPYIEDLFCNRLDCSVDESFESLKGVKVSAHLLIKRNGSVVQFVNLNERAWHAGVSCFEDIDNCNDYSIGIELEGTDNIAYSAIQYKTLIALTKSIMQYYPSITPSRIVGHNTIAPLRKTDPGISFDWAWFRKKLTKE